MECPAAHPQSRPLPEHTPRMKAIVLLTLLFQPSSFPRLCGEETLCAWTIRWTKPGIRPEGAIRSVECFGYNATPTSIPDLEQPGTTRNQAPCRHPAGP